MKKTTITTLLMLLCTITFSQELEGTWTTTLDTDNGPYTFFAEYNVDGDALKGRLYSVDGSVNISDGKINGDEFEYKFLLNYSEIKHKGKLVDGELKIKSITENNESEFAMTRYSKVAGKWEATIQTENGPFTFNADFDVKGDAITGYLSSEYGAVDIKKGKIEDDEFEYSFKLDGNLMNHKGKLVDGKLKVKSTGGEFGEIEYEMSRVEK